MPLSKEEVDALDWKGEVIFRVLSYYFVMRWNRPVLGKRVREVLGRFEVEPDPLEFRSPPTPGLPVRYSLVDHGADHDTRYRLLYGDHQLISGNEPGDVFDHLMWHINSEVGRQTGDFLLIHAGAVRAPSGQGLILPAPTGSGKTTLVAGLIRSGFEYLSDEAAAIDPVTRKLYPYPKALSIKPGSVRVVKTLLATNGRRKRLGRQWHLVPEDIREGSMGGPCEVGLVVFPRYDAESSTVISPMSRAEAVMELGRNTMNLSIYRARAVLLLAEVVRHARCYKFGWGDLKEAAEAIAELAQPAGPSTSPEVMAVRSSLDV